MSSQTESCESIPLNNLIREVSCNAASGGGGEGQLAVSSLSMSFDISSDSQASFFHLSNSIDNNNFEQQRYCCSRMEQLKQDGVHDVSPRIPRSEKSQVSFSLSMGSEESKDNSIESEMSRRSRASSSRQRSTTTRTLRKKKRPVKTATTTTTPQKDTDDEKEPNATATAPQQLCVRGGQFSPTNRRQGSGDAPPKMAVRSESLQSLHFMVPPVRTASADSSQASVPKKTNSNKENDNEHTDEDSVTQTMTPETSAEDIDINRSSSDFTDLLQIQDGNDSPAKE